MLLLSLCCRSTSPPLSCYTSIKTTEKLPFFCHIETIDELFKLRQFQHAWNVISPNSQLDFVTRRGQSLFFRNGSLIWHYLTFLRCRIVLLGSMKMWGHPMHKAQSRPINQAQQTPAMWALIWNRCEQLSMCSMSWSSPSTAFVSLGMRLFQRSACHWEWRFSLLVWLAWL